ncbi:MAG TPA: hypothetical protein DIT93_12795 [Pelagibacterium sp.]|nr:hypothetical protein [Pelagibacterium sp.]
MSIELYQAVHSGQSQSVSSWAFEELSRRIIDGRLSPGERVTEEALVKEIGASRTPVRDAIKQLEELGLIVRERNRTLRIAPLQSEELLELVSLREHLEGLAAFEVTRLVALGKASTSRLWEIIDQLEDAESKLEGTKRTDRIFELGTVFHATLVASSGMGRVARIHAGLQLALARYRLVNATDGRRLVHRSQEHRQIVEALEAGEPAGAEHAMRQHIREGLKAYTTNTAAGETTDHLWPVNSDTLQGEH